MRFSHIITSLLFVLSSCNRVPTKEKQISKVKDEFQFYSKSVGDTFVIHVQLPENYSADSLEKFPAIYMLDANFHFPMLATTAKEYEKVELLPPLIIIGIGYKTFQLMDSLRNRDYLYPAGLPSDEMKTPGGGMKFDKFIAEELIPFIDSKYRTNKTDRTLMGHSFGGYFTLLALLNQVESNKSYFKNFISASPSLWYNNFYLNQLPDKLKNRQSKDPLNVFVSEGGLEDSVWGIMPLKKLSQEINKSGLQNLKWESHIYSDLGHMDVAQLTFLKGLEEFYLAHEK